MTHALFQNMRGESLGVSRMEIHSDPNKHDYAIVKLAGNTTLEEAGWQENEPVRLTWGQTVGESSRSRTLMSREMVGYIAGPHVEHEATTAFTEIHVLGATSILQLADLREEEWVQRSAVSVIREILGRVHLELHVEGVDEVPRQLIEKPAEQTYWDFLVELAKSAGATMHPINATVLLIGHQASLLLPEQVSETASGGPHNFRFSVRASTRSGRQRKRWKIEYNDLNTGRKRTIDHRHLPSLNPTADRTITPTERLATATQDMGSVSYGEAFERLAALTYEGHRYVEADLHLPYPVFTAFAGASLRIETRELVGPTGRRVESGRTETGVWRVESVTHIIDLQSNAQTYVMDLDLSRAGLGPQQIRQAKDTRALVEKAHRFSGRFHQAKGWAA